MNNANDLAAAVLANNNDTKTKTATTTSANKSITHNNSNTNKNNVVSTNLRAVKESSSLCNNNSSVASSNLNALEQQHQQQPVRIPFRYFKFTHHLIDESKYLFFLEISKLFSFCFSCVILI
jgi:hypothetical protein